MKHPKGHSNVHADQTVEWVAGDDTRAHIPLEGGATAYSVRPLPSLALTRAEWELIGQRMNWLETRDALVHALQIAEATINRLATPHGPFNSAQGTLDIITAAVSKAQKPLGVPATEIERIAQTLPTCAGGVHGCYGSGDICAGHGSITEEERPS